MAHESFESAATAAVMNEHFVNVKVDREERPDVDALYMDATVSMTGQGGWPMTVFLTPAGRAVLRRHVLPARAAARDAVLHAAAARGRRGVARLSATTSSCRRGGSSRRSVTRRGSSRRRSRSPRRSSTRRSRGSPARSTVRTAASAGRRSSRPPRRSSSCCGATRPRRSRWSRRRSTRWPRAGCTTSSAAASTATRSTTAGSCRTSRRCSTTTRCSRPRTSTPGS